MATFQLLVFDARRGNHEGDEEEKLLGFYPDTLPATECISLAGLVQGLHMFSQSMGRAEEDGDKFEISETDLSVWATYEAEPDVFLVLVALKSWLPRHTSQSNLLAFLMHTHHLMTTLFCGVQYMLDKDETGELARGSIASVLRSVGDELLNSSSWVNKELRNPLTTLGHAAMLQMPVPITLDVHSLCHRALNASHAGARMVEMCMVLFNRCVLWSTFSGQVTAALSALAHSSIFPESNTAPGGSVANILRLAGGGSSRRLQQLDNGFLVMRKDDANPGEDDERYSLPFIYCDSSLEYLLAYGRGDLLLLMVGAQPTISIDALATLQFSIEPIAIQLLARLAQESQAQGGELGHFPGWRYVAQEESGLGVRASPRSKISAMSHHARALATSLTDSLNRMTSASEDEGLEVCARSTQGVWAVAEMGPGVKRRMVETQQRQFCLLHAINNLLQSKACTAVRLDEIADGLAPGRLPLPLLHPHRIILFGNWDISVLELALQDHKRVLKWHDQRDTTFETIHDGIFGLIVNVRSAGPLAAVFGWRHWFALRKFDGKWYNLDSKLSAPQLVPGPTVAEEEDEASKEEVGGDAALHEFLTRLIRDSDAKIFLVT